MARQTVCWRNLDNSFGIHSTLLRMLPCVRNRGNRTQIIRNTNKPFQLHHQFRRVADSKQQRPSSFRISFHCIKGRCSPHLSNLPVGVCTPLVAHTVVATTWVRNHCTTKEKNITNATRHDAASGVQSVRRRVALALTFATLHRAAHVLFTNMSFVREVIFLQFHEVQTCFHT